MNRVYLYAGLSVVAVLMYFYISALRNEVKFLNEVAKEAQSANANLSRDLNATLKRHENELKQVQNASDEKEALREEVALVKERVIVKHSELVPRFRALVDELFKNEK